MRIYKILIIVFAIFTITTSIFFNVYVNYKLPLLRDIAKPVGLITEGNISICIDVGPPPVLDNIDDLYAYENTPFNYGLIATDTETFYYHDNATFFDVNTTTGHINFTADSGDVGSYGVRFWASHDLCDDYYDEDIITFTVIAAAAEEEATEISSAEYGAIILGELEETISLGSSLKFDLNGKTYFLKVKQIYYNNKKVEFEFVSEENVFSMKERSEIKMDIEKDDKIDLSLNLVEIESPNSVRVKLKLYIDYGCKEKWKCDDWSECTSIEKAENLKDIFISQCEKNNIAKEDCGFKFRFCNDENKCGSKKEKPVESGVCSVYKKEIKEEKPEYKVDTNLNMNYKLYIFTVIGLLLIITALIIILKLKNKKLIFTNKLLREFKKEIRKKNLHRAETIYRRLLLDLNNYEGNRKKKIEKKIFSLKAKLLNLKNRITKRRM
ncbi:hypothetical protein AUJ10_02100 [Candidatus Pacearchaeota archaeon CG1_02_31_27]|nr:MAG: hypothetical protein AUJ10_02100 [Candidatus Pacearchaeota archaeon CG1_02_31_27]PIN91976.1 MAG: hypothetical protein COU55_03270 [Candidatus Pacearchaeota archaeon CG10_big_fil_rev_8_21_14_0_10_31_59]PIZ80774.1 MAG: hypothetical protein COX99_01665 [Candidatus Pacearchaeota archaeon CG_4_10_14_0_2_um_filter_31_10]